MKNKNTQYVILLAILIIGLGYIWLNDSPVSSEPVIQQISVVSDDDVGTSPAPIVTISDSIKSYAYLFEGSREPMTSNIVGYFGSGAFAWYVPDWLVTNWELAHLQNGVDMDITPKIKDDSGDFSDIRFVIKPSTESFNAVTLYEVQRKASDNATVVSEVLLNQHSEGDITLLIETDTRIYHVQRTSLDRIKDYYYIDGNGMTLEVTFDALPEIYHQFSSKIRSLVEGIGEIKALQG